VWGSLGLWLPFLGILGALCPSTPGLAPLCGLGDGLVGTPVFWLGAVICAPGAALLADWCLLVFPRLMSPTASQVLQEMEKLAAKAGLPTGLPAGLPPGPPAAAAPRPAGGDEEAAAAAPVAPTAAAPAAAAAAVGRPQGLGLEGLGVAPGAAAPAAAAAGGRFDAWGERPGAAAAVAGS
jgi:hypothetical protein